MKKVQCRLNTGVLIASEVYLADNFYSRLVGLMFTKLSNAKPILVKPTQSIQTCFMRFNLDVVFIDRNKKIIKIIRNMKPWRFTNFYCKARAALELPAGSLPEAIKIGQTLEFIDV